jgi:hypothetical protein
MHPTTSSPASKTPPCGAGKEVDEREVMVRQANATVTLPDRVEGVKS